MANCPYCASDDKRSTGNDLRSLGWTDNGTTNEVECKECGRVFNVDHSGDTPTVNQPSSGGGTSDESVATE